MLNVITEDKYIKLFLKEWLVIAVIFLPVLIYFESWLFLPVISYYYAGLYYIIKNVLKKVSMIPSDLYNIFLFRFLKVVLIQLIVIAVYIIVKGVN